MKKLYIFSLILLGITSLTSCNKETPVSDKNTSNIPVAQEQSKDLVISGHPEWPPIMYKQDDQINGVWVEIVKKIFAELWVNTISKYEGTWDQVQEKAKNWSIDVLVAAYKTAERETYMDYSIPYTIDPIVLVVKKWASLSYSGWTDLLDKKLVVTKWDSYGQDFDNFIKEKLKVTEVSTPKEAFDLLENGEADYFIYALYSADNYLYTNKVAEKFDIIPKYVSSENFYVTISKKSPFASLLPKFNELLQKYKNDWTIDQIITKTKESLWNKK